MLGDTWLDWVMEKLVMPLLILMLIGCVVLIPIVGYQSRKDHDEACAQIMAMARTNQDSIAVALRCRLGSDHKTAGVPVVAPVIVR